MLSHSKVHIWLPISEIFDFKVLGVWPWPLTSEGHLGSKYFILFESSYMTPYLFLWTPSVFLVPLSRYSTHSFQGLTLTFDLRRSSGVKKIIPLFDCRWSSAHTGLCVYLFFSFFSFLFKFRFIFYLISIFLGGTSGASGWVLLLIWIFVYIFLFL